MHRLTLIRHGLTDWNASGRFQGHSDVPLPCEGRAQCERLRDYVAAFPSADVAVSSTRARARETACIAFPAEAVRLHDGAHVVVVSHSGTLQMLLSHLIDDGMDPFAS